MKTQGTGTIELKSWDENSYSEVEGVKLTHAIVKNTYHGAIEGEGTLQYLMSYVGENSSFFGLEHIVGRIGERSGSFIVRHEGTFENGTAKVNLSVVPGSGLGDLRGLQGEGEFTAQGQVSSYTFNYDFAQVPAEAEQAVSA